MAPTKTATDTLRALPTDEIRQVMWRMADLYSHQILVQSARAVARGPVARLVAGGARHSHDWTPEKATLLQAFDDAGITAVYLDPESGGFIDGPKNFALSLAAFELAWVDAGAATCSLAGHLGLAPIHERGTPEQAAHYMAATRPAQPGEDRRPLRGAFCLTEPIPYVGVETGILGGKVRVVEWEEGHEPMLHVDKRGRFITNMGFANFVTAAVDSDDEAVALMNDSEFGFTASIWTSDPDCVRAIGPRLETGTATPRASVTTCFVTSHSTAPPCCLTRWKILSAIASL